MGWAITFMVISGKITIAMAKKPRAVSLKKAKRKEMMSKILDKISEAMKEYATPASERKIARKLRKASKGLTAIVVKTKK